ncbi:MAG: SMI1/KNR4 family protein [Anaerolineae bacterium]|nr:SMI1/KNR4 family protein [Anaerolineae bacterium]
MPVTILDAEDPITYNDVARLEERLGFRLPEDYRAFLLQHNGGRPKPNVFSLTDTDLATTEDTIAWFMCIKPGDVNDLLETASALQGRIPNNLLPIAVDPFGNYICIAVLGPDKGRIYFWDHELESTVSNVYFLADSFDNLLHSLRELES